MKATYLNTGWSYRHLEDEGLGTPVTIPHDAMLAEPRGPESACGINGAWFEGHDYLYTRKFTAESGAGVQILEFEGVYRKAEVWVNGKQAAYRPYGYTNFYVPLDSYLQPGENTIEVIARNADQPNSRWYSGAGIYRPVVLWTGPESYILPNGIRVKTVSIENPAVEVSVRTVGSGNVTVEILDGETVLATAQGECSGDVSFRMELPGAGLWSPDSPKLYTCRVRFGEDSAQTSFGLRMLSWSEDGLKLNGQRIILRGACIHHDNGLLGACCYDAAVERKVRILQSGGYNAIRSAHNPCSKALLDACDKLGMLVMDEYIDHWYIHKTEYDYVEHFSDWWHQDLSDMVDKDYNHPCVILYSTGNEVSETAQPKGIALTRELTETLHTLDGTRPVTCGVNIFFNFLSSIGFGVYSDEKAKKEAAAADKRKDKPKKKKAVGSQFFNDLAGLMGDEFMKIGATLHGCDVRTRDAFANMDMAGYNYGIRRYRGDLKRYPHRLILGSETFCSDAAKFWDLAQKEPRLIGDFVWAGIDYLGEVGIGSWEYKDYAPSFDHGPGWISAGSGRIDLTGKLLGEALYTRVAFNLSPLEFAVCPVNATNDRHSPSAWKMSNAMESWAWNGCDGKKARVEVYSRAPQVELQLNGTSLGKKASGKDALTVFHISYAPGTLKALAYDENGKLLAERTLTSASETTQLRAEPESPSVSAENGLCYIRLRYTDENGVGKPLARGKIHLTVSGGKLLGFGSACPYYEGSYLSDTADTYYGEALAIVQPLGAGTVKVTAESPFGNAEAEIAAE